MLRRFVRDRFSGQKILETFLARRLGSAIRQYLPEGKLKELLRKKWWQPYGHRIAIGLNRIISHLELAEKEVLFVKLKSGLSFYGPIGGVILPWMKYADAGVLGKLKGLDLFSTFLSNIYEIMCDEVYERFFPVRRGDLVVDCGACVGLFAVKAAKLAGDRGRVVAIEPHPHSFSLMLENVNLNNLGTVIAVRRGVYSRRESLKLHLSSDWPGSHSLYINDGDSYGTKSDLSITVEVDALDTILQELSITSVDFIKMDIEGAEIEAMKGMDEVFRADVRLAIAAYHPINGKPSYKTVIPHLLGLGFEVRYDQGLVYAYKREGGKKAKR